MGVAIFMHVLSGIQSQLKIPSFTGLLVYGSNLLRGYSVSVTIQSRYANNWLLIAPAPTSQSTSAEDSFPKVGRRRELVEQLLQLQHIQPVELLFLSSRRFHLLSPICLCPAKIAPVGPCDPLLKKEDYFQISDFKV